MTEECVAKTAIDPCWVTDTTAARKRVEISLELQIILVQTKLFPKCQSTVEFHLKKLRGNFNNTNQCNHFQDGDVSEFWKERQISLNDQIFLSSKLPFDASFIFL